MNHNKSVAESNDNKVKKTVPVVAIGGSAGAIEAMKIILANLSPNLGMAYVYIQHLAPEFESNLDAILGRSTKMEVMEATHMLPIAPDKLYIIPPDKDMSIIDGVLTLSPRQERPAIHMPIDQFFTSLAERQKEGAIAVLLSGSNTDGTLGLKAIRSEGGVTIAQDDSAAFQSMPQAAITEGVVDMVLSPADIATELERLSKDVPLITGVMSERPENNISDTDEDLASILQLLKKSVGVDFTHYKMNTIKRRILRRMILHKKDTLDDYSKYLKQNTGEVDLLYQDLLINVTTFFRDPDAIAFLKQSIFPRILAAHSPSDPVRIWVPACASGEEAYSIAIILVELLGEQTTNIPIQIFATDLSELAINKARLGIYPINELTAMPPKYLQRFFTKVDGSYRVAKHIRDLCVFATHNVFKDPPFFRLDLISCCNLMIYLDTVLQKKLLSTFHYALQNDGFLVLGKSESVSAAPGLFTNLDKKIKVYSKKESANRKLFEAQFRLPEIELKERVDNRAYKKHTGYASDLEKMVDDMLLSKYVPACVVVNDELEILQFKGSTGLYLEPAPGKASLNLLKMAKPGLAFDLRNNIHKALRSGEVVKKKGIEAKWGDKVHYINIEVVPLRNNKEGDHCLVIFEQAPLSDKHDTSVRVSKDKQVKKLEEELISIKEDMQAIIEEQQASNEELQSANEEIVSSNEELQSINEELETSKEELESTNEELMTINTELLMRNEQLAEAQDYAEALFNTIRKAVLLLDENLRVKTANKAFFTLFQMQEEEVEGKLVYEMDHQQWNIPQLKDLLEDIIPRNTTFHGFEVKHNFSNLGEKIMLLDAAKVVQKTNRQKLIILTIEDVTEQRLVQKKMNEKDALLEAMAENMPVMVWAAGTDKQRYFFNKQWLEFTGCSLEQAQGDVWLKSVHQDDQHRYLKTFNKFFEERKPYVLEYRLQHKDGTYQLVQEEGRPVFTGDGNFSGFTGSCTPVA